MLRYSLATLFVLLLYLSVGFAALVNVTGVWLCMKYEITQMLKQGGGAICR